MENMMTKNKYDRLIDALDEYSQKYDDDRDHAVVTSAKKRIRATQSMGFDENVGVHMFLSSYRDDAEYLEYVDDIMAVHFSGALNAMTDAIREPTTLAQSITPSLFRKFASEKMNDEDFSPEVCEWIVNGITDDEINEYIALVNPDYDYEDESVGTFSENMQRQLDLACKKIVDRITDSF